MSGVFSISEAALLAVHAMNFIARHHGRTVSTREIAEFYHASEAHLSKVMQRLAKAGMVKSVRGPKGGFILGKNCGDITLLDLYELFEGTLIMNSCLFSKPKCSRQNCIFGDLFKEFNVRVKNFLENKNLNDTIENFK